jgi:hypothetical protein
VENILGVTEYQAGWRIKGYLTSAEVAQLAHDLIKFVGMTPDPPFDLREYPNATGHGGVGIQLYQPLTESWLVVGTWPDHGFFRVNLSSCKPFDYGATTSWLGRFGQILRTYDFPL